MWIGAYEREGRTDFFAITSDKASLGPFTTFAKAQAALKAYEEKLGNDKADLIASLIPVHTHRQTRMGKNGFNDWKIADTVAEILILFYRDNAVGEGYLVIYEDGFVYVGVYPSLPTAEKSAADTAKRLGLRSPRD